MHTHIVQSTKAGRFFNATAQEDGCSVLLEWELEYDGGEEVDTIFVQVGGISYPFLPAGRLLFQLFDLIFSWTLIYITTSEERIQMLYLLAIFSSMQIFREGILVNTTTFLIESDRGLITGLDPTTSYIFQARASNSLGRSEAILSSVVTTLGRSQVCSITYLMIACVPII